MNELMEAMRAMMAAMVAKDRADRVLGEEGFYVQHRAEENLSEAESDFEVELESYVTARISKALEVHNETSHG
jgi:hypothetical protein